MFSFIDRRVGKIYVVQQPELVTLLPSPGEDLFEYAKEFHTCRRSADLLIELSGDRFGTGFPELDPTSKRNSDSLAVDGS